MAPKSPAVPNLRRSSRASTPTQRATSPRSVTHSTSTPSISTQLLQPSSSSSSSAVRKSTSARSLTPTRPALPKHAANDLLLSSAASANAPGTKLHKVKLQTLHLGEDNGTITIARVKCPVPKGRPGHIIKRFDTNAVSASSLFCAAFPTADDKEEADEMDWIAKKSKNRYGDTVAAGMETDPSRKLSGVWVPAAHAATLALEYGILKYAEDLIKFSVDDAAASATPSTTRTRAADSLQVADSETDSPAPASSTRSPRSKRQRVISPTRSSGMSPTPRGSSALSGASAPGVSILQTLESDPQTGVVTETTRVSVDVPAASVAPDAQGHEGGNGLVASDEDVARQIEQAKLLVESLKEDGTLKRLEGETEIVGGTKRALADADVDVDEGAGHEEDEGDENEKPTKRGFFGRVFGKKDQRRQQRERQERARVGQQLVAVVPQSQIQQAGPGVVVEEEVEGRRWVAGFGLALAVGATAAAPYLFG